jgi:methionine synthase I (cobalamin-dependent)
MLQRYNFSKKILEENVSKFSAFAKRKQRFVSVTHRKAIKDVALFDAGADIVETNTFRNHRSVWPVPS